MFVDLKLSVNAKHATTWTAIISIFEEILHMINTKWIIDLRHKRHEWMNTTQIEDYRQCLMEHAFLFEYVAIKRCLIAMDMGTQQPLSVGSLPVVGNF